MTVESEDPPDEPDTVVVALADQTVDVVGEAAVVACDGGEIGEVGPAP